MMIMQVVYSCLFILGRMTDATVAAAGPTAMSLMIIVSSVYATLLARRCSCEVSALERCGLYVQIAYSWNNIGQAYILLLRSLFFKSLISHCAIWLVAAACIVCFQAFVCVRRAFGGHLHIMLCHILTAMNINLLLMVLGTVAMDATWPVACVAFAVPRDNLCVHMFICYLCRGHPVFGQTPDHRGKLTPRQCRDLLGVVPNAGYHQLRAAYKLKMNALSRQNAAQCKKRTLLKAYQQLKGVRKSYVIKDKVSFTKQSAVKACSKHAIARVAKRLGLTREEVKAVSCDMHFAAARKLATEKVKILRQNTPNKKIAAKAAEASNPLVNFLSLRFGCPQLLNKAQALQKLLQDSGQEAILVSGPSGQHFGEQVSMGLHRMHRFVPLVTDDPAYGAYNKVSKYSTYFELKFAYEHNIPIVPVVLTTCPWPLKYLGHQGDDQGQALLSMAISPTLRFIDAKTWTAKAVAKEVLNSASVSR